MRGLSLLDRIIALDFLATLALGFTAIYAVATTQTIFLGVAIVLALTVCLSPVLFAHFIEKRKLAWRKS